MSETANLSDEQLWSLARKHERAAESSEALLTVARLRTSPDQATWLNFHESLAVWHRQQAQWIRNDISLKSQTGPTS